MSTPTQMQLPLEWPEAYCGYCRESHEQPCPNYVASTRRFLARADNAWVMKSAALRLSDFEQLDNS